MEEGRVDRALHYQFDWAATLIDLAGGRVPPSWDGQSFAAELTTGHIAGREFLITSQGAWSCQRGIRFRDSGRDVLCLVTYHDGYKQLRPLALYDLAADPHEVTDISASEPGLVVRAQALLARWLAEMMERSASNVDPLMTVLREGGPFHCRGQLPAYLRRLRKTGRESAARILERRHPAELHEPPDPPDPY